MVLTDETKKKQNFKMFLYYSFIQWIDRGIGFFCSCVSRPVCCVVVKAIEKEKPLVFAPHAYQMEYERNAN